MLNAEQVTFLLCIESNQLEAQGVLACESIRTFGGRYANARIIAISPRPELALGSSARKRLDDLHVTYVVEPLNTTGHPYGTINRIVAGAWAETAASSSHLAALDTDTAFLGEPLFHDAEVGVRPVDVKGSASSGPADRLDLYWARMCSFGGIGLDDLPMIEATVKPETIRASYNGGFVIVRRSLGILSRTRDIFFRSLSEGLRPRPDSKTVVRASTGLVGTQATEWWGSSQAALAVAIWSTTKDVLTYGAGYNIPLHLLVNPEREWPMGPGSAPVLVHYHYLTEPSHQADLLKTLESIGCSSRAVDWMRKRLAGFA